MRRFSLTLNVPAKCDCCGGTLPAHPFAWARGEYSLSLPEGEQPVDISIGDGLLVILGGGKLEVHLQQKHGSGRGWDLKRNFNTDAFGHPKRESWGSAGSTWYGFVFKLPADFKPSFSTWWAQLEFFETEAFKRDWHGGEVEAHSAARVKLRLETLE